MPSFAMAMLLPSCVADTCTRETRVRPAKIDEKTNYTPSWSGNSL